MKSKIIILLSLILTASITYGQKFQKGSISLSDGSVKNGLVAVPKGPSVKELSFKQNEGADKEEIEVEQVNSLHVISESGKKYVFECRYATGRKDKLTKNKYVLLKVKEGYADLYFSGNGYKTDKEGNVMTHYSYYSGKDLPTFVYYLRKKGEENFSVLGMTSPSPTMFGLNNMLKKNAAVLLSDDEALVKKIEDGEYKHEDMPTIVDVYNKNMAGK